MDDNVANELIDFITAKEHDGQLCIFKNPYWKAKCTRHITMEKGRIILDQKNNLC
jgi:hypothetical protein